MKPSDPATDPSLEAQPSTEAELTEAKITKTESSAAESSAAESSAAESTRRGFELSDANPRQIAWAALGAGIVIVFISLALLGFHHFRQGEAAELTLHFDQSKRPRPIAVDQSSVHTMRREQLEQTRWLDADADVLQIPIERAMELISNESPTP